MLKQILLAVTVTAVSAVSGLTQTSAVGHYAEVNGIKLYYEIIGEPNGGNTPLVLLHGGLGAIEMFGPNLPALAKGRQVIAVDLQAHGRTADIDRPFKLEHMADDIGALIKYLGIPKADIMGYSLGAGVALQTAIRHSDVTNKLVLVSAITRRNAFYPEILAMQEQVNGNMAEQMKPTPMYQLYASLAPRPQDWPKLLDKIGKFMKEFDSVSTEQISSVKNRVMVVAGDADIFPPSHAVELFGLFGGGKRDGGWDGSGRSQSRLAILPGVTHYSIGNDPVLAATVIPFLDEAAPATR